MGSQSVSRIFRRLSAAAAVSLMLGSVADAGQFKTVNTVTNLGVLVPGGAITLISSPKTNLGGVMEMELYEFQTPPAGGSWQLVISQNNTGQDLNARLIGVNGTIIASCTTPVNGTCSTVPIALVGNLKFMAIVATDAFSPIAPGNQTYTIRIRRTA
jgi:hypothetical protein